tara:strand:- start:152 stop:466 length:315 start_codon:yes stop_codon:yes gene_type:complete
MIKNSLLALVLMISFNANAWWDTGHEMVCSEAYNLLSPAAKKAVDPLSEAEGSFGRSCLWADWVKRERRETGNWHYINLPMISKMSLRHAAQKTDALFKLFMIR